MGERTAAARVCVQAGASNQLRITGFDSLDGIEDHFYVRKVDLTVAVQVRHLAVPFLVDEHVSRITKLVTAVTRAALATNGEVVGGGAESGTNPHALGVDSVVVQVLNDQLELVEQRLTQNDVFRPDIF